MEHAGPLGAYPTLAKMTRSIPTIGGLSDSGVQLNYEAWSIGGCVASRYGHGQIADVMAGIEKHEDWDESARGIFGVSSADFERGWRTHLDDFLRE